MLPFACGLSYVSAVLPALRTQTATLNGDASGGDHVHVLLVDQPVWAHHVEPS
jgi:hypothetical protein